jgi:hypothetical protein
MTRSLRGPAPPTLGPKPACARLVEESLRTGYSVDVRPVLEGFGKTCKESLGQVVELRNHFSGPRLETYGATCKGLLIL